MAETLTVSRRNIETALIQKCWKDADFRKQVLKDPKGMLEKHTGKKLPADVKIYIHEESPDKLHFSIPPTPSNIAELSDDDLEKVAGGTDIILTMAAVTLLGSAALSAAGVTALNKGSVGW